MSMLLKNSFLKQIQRVKVWLAFLIFTLLMTPSALLLAQSGNPVLDIANQEASPNSQVSLPIQFTANGHQINSIAFSIDYDENWLSFDNTDGNSDGIPDAMSLSLPAGYSPMVTFDASDTDGEIDIAIFTLSPSPLPDGQIGVITLGVGNPPSPTEAAVAFSSDPVASFGNTSGQSVDGTADGGSVLIDYGGGGGGGDVIDEDQSLATVSIGGLRSIEMQEINFGLVSPNGQNFIATVPDENEEAWIATHTIDNPDGWHLVLKAMGDFSDGQGNFIPIDMGDGLNGFKVSFSDDDIVPRPNSNTSPQSLVSTSQLVSTNGITILTAPSATGEGIYDFIPHFELFIPGGSAAGNYETTVVVEMVTGP